MDAREEFIEAHVIGIAHERGIISERGLTLLDSIGWQIKNLTEDNKAELSRIEKIADLAFRYIGAQVQVLEMLDKAIDKAGKSGRGHKTILNGIDCLLSKESDLACRYQLTVGGLSTRIDEYILGEPYVGSTGVGSPWYNREDTSPWQENAIRALEEVA